MKSHKFLLGVLSLVSLLSACSGEPSEANLRTAVETELTDLNNYHKQVGGPQVSDSDLIKLHGLKKSECVKDTDEPGFSCAVELDLEAPYMRPGKHQRQLKVVKSDGGWHVVSGLQGN